MNQDNNEKLYEFDSLNAKIIKAVDSFIKFTGMAVSYYDSNADLKWESHNNKKICSFCKAYEDKDSLCRMNLKYSGNIAAQLGEQYVFLCKARLTLIAFPIMNDGVHVGTFIAGPIILGKLRSNVIEYIINRNISIKKQAKILIELHETKIYDPKTVSSIADIFGYCMLASINTNPQYENISNSFKTVQKMSERIRQNKQGLAHRESSYPLKLEGELIETVTSGDFEESIELLHKYLESVTLFNIGDIGLIKLDIIQMCGLLLRKIKEDVSVFEEAKDKYDVQLSKINQATNIAELSGIISDLIEQLTTLFEREVYMGDVELVKNTIAYISKNYKNKISLKNVADYLHVSSPYLSTLFKKEMGKTFSDFLTRYRIKKSESLLLETSMSITEVAMHSGFEDQSYFNKVFKKTTGLTPRAFKYKEDQNNQ